MEKLKNIFIKIWPYLLILIFSIMGTYLVFYKGLNNGDDYKFHIGNIMDYYLTFTNGDKLSPISGNLALGLGAGNRLFYSPFAHFMIAIMSVIVNVFGGSIFLGYKIVIVLSVFISGIFMYRFAMHFTKNNKVASLLAAACFVLYPYRLFDAFCRIAIAEAISIMFLPLFFMGLYDVTHFKDKVNSLAFVEIVIGGSLLFLSHNITALYSFLAGIIYLLCNIKGIIKSFKLKNYVLYCGIGIFLLIGISSIALFTQLELMSLDLYNVSDPVTMWANPDKVASRTQEELNYSGFLNVVYFNGNFSHLFTISSLIISLVLFVVFSIIFVLLDLTLQEIKVLKKFHLIISSAVLFLLVSIISPRLEIYLATAIVILIYMYVIYNINKIDSNKQENKKIYMNIMFWYCITMIVVLIVMMESKWVWYYLPSIFLNIQFPWRLWALVQLFASILVGLLAYYFDYKKSASITLVLLVALLMAANQPLFEKRMQHTYNFDKKWETELTEKNIKEKYTLGFCREYLPQVITDRNYKSEYDYSLHRKIRNRLLSGYEGYENYYYSPVYLTGNATITVNDAFSPNYDMNIEASEDSLIQMPLIYYPGYEIVVTDLSNNESYTVEALNIDGLIAFKLQEGNYKVTTDYVGTTTRKISKVYFFVSLSATTLWILYALFVENGKYKKLLELLNKDKKVANK